MGVTNPYIAAGVVLGVLLLYCICIQWCKKYDVTQRLENRVYVMQDNNAPGMEKVHPVLAVAQYHLEEAKRLKESMERKHKEADRVVRDAKKMVELATLEKDLWRGLREEKTLQEAKQNPYPVIQDMEPGKFAGIDHMKIPVRKCGVRPSAGPATYDRERQERMVKSERGFI